jgi:hypothetical protein
MTEDVLENLESSEEFVCAASNVGGWAIFNDL